MASRRASGGRNRTTPVRHRRIRLVGAYTTTGERGCGQMGTPSDDVQDYSVSREVSSATGPMSNPRAHLANEQARVPNASSEWELSSMFRRLAFRLRSWNLSTSLRPSRNWAPRRQGSKIAPRFFPVEMILGVALAPWRLGGQSGTGTRDRCLVPSSPHWSLANERARVPNARFERVRGVCLRAHEGTEISLRPPCLRVVCVCSSGGKAMSSCDAFRRNALCMSAPAQHTWQSLIRAQRVSYFGSCAARSSPICCRW
jgi:hypothetical protein